MAAKDIQSEDKLLMYVRPTNISHNAKIFKEDYYVRRDRWTSTICKNGIVKDVKGTITVIEKFAQTLIDQQKYDLAFAFWIDALNTIISPSGIYFGGHDAEVVFNQTKCQMKKIKSSIATLQFASKPIVVSGLFLSMIESAQRKKKFAWAGDLLDTTLQRIEHLVSVTVFRKGLKYFIPQFHIVE